MVTILDAGTGPGALAGLKRLVLDFQLGPWAPPLWNSLSSKPQLHLPKGRGSTHRNLLATVRSQTPGWWSAGLSAIAQIFINVTIMLKAGLLVCNHTFFLPASLDFLSGSIYSLSLEKYQAHLIAFLIILRL